MAKAQPRPDLTPSRTFPLLADRPVARAGAWYEMVPAQPGPGARPARDVRRLHRAAAGNRRARLRRRSTSRRSIRSAASTARAATMRSPPSPDDPGSPYAIGAAEGGHDAIHPELGTLDDFRRLVARLPTTTAWRWRSISRSSARPIIPGCKQHPEWFKRRPDGSIQICRESAEEISRTSSIRISTAPTAPRCGPRLRDVVPVLGRAGRAHFPRRQSAHQAVPFWEWLIREVQAAIPA